MAAMASPELQWNKPSSFSVPLTAPADGCRRSIHHGSEIPRNKTSLGTCHDTSVLSLPIPVGKRSSIDSQRSSISSCRLRHTLNMKRAGTRHAVETAHRLKMQMEEINLNKSRFKQQGEALSLFKKVVRRAIICSHWVSCVLKVKHNYLESQLEQLTDRSKSMEQTLYLKQMELAGTVFNKQEYMPNREICLKSEIQYILTLPPESRSKAEITRALNSLQSVKSFTEFPSHVQYRLCQVAWYQQVPPRKVIVRQGHRGLNFYFVISGRGIIKVLRRRADGTIMNGERVVFKIERGSSFGDIALLHNVERTATVESHTEMSLLMIGKDDFVRIFLQREMDGVRPEHTTFLKTVSALQHWPVDCLTKTTGNCIFHYFKRGKLIVADSNNSDFLYIIKSGSCEVIKQLKPVTSQPHSKCYTRRENSEMVKQLMIGIRTKAKVSSWTKLPPVIKNFVAQNPCEDVRKALERLVKAKRDEPNLMLDIPDVIRGELEEVQKRLASHKLHAKPALMGVVSELVTNGRKEELRRAERVSSAERKDECREASSKLCDNDISGRESLASQSEEIHNEDPTMNKPTDIKPKKRAHFADLPLMVDEPAVDVSKSKMVQVTKKWKQVAAGKSDNTFKELNRAKGIAQVPDTLISEAMDEAPSYSNFPKMEAASLMISHEGKKQTFLAQGVGDNKASPESVVFVRLGLLRSKDVFGLETLDFDANYSVSDTSVCLVSRGAEVLMLRKKFFLENCNSENLEHLRTVVCPYPMESSMQDNLKVSVDWSTYCDQLISKVLQRIAARRQAR